MTGISTAFQSKLIILLVKWLRKGTKWGWGFKGIKLQFQAPMSWLYEKLKYIESIIKGQTQKNLNFSMGETNLKLNNQIFQKRQFFA